MRVVLPRHVVAVSAASPHGWCDPALPRRDWEFFRFRPGARPAVQPRPHLARATLDFLGGHVVSGGGHLSRPDDYGAGTAPAELAFLFAARRAGDRRLRQPGRGIRGPSRMESEGLVVVWQSGF